MKNENPKPDLRLRSREGKLVGTLELSQSKPFEEAWSKLFSEPIHLDSLLSKQNDSVKSMMAEWFQGILLQPVSFCRRARLPLLENEPYGLDRAHLAEWNRVRPLADAWRSNAIRYSMLKEAGIPEDFPSWLTDEWKKDWGTEVTQYLIKVLSSPAPLTLRKSVRTDVKVPSGGKDSEMSPLAHSFPTYQMVRNTEDFLAGKYEIQDEGSQLISLFCLWPDEVSRLLQKTPGELKGKVPWPLSKKPLRMVDACSGAGGKALAFADLLKGQGRVFAYDVSEKKLQALSRRARRTDLRNIQTVTVQRDAVPGEFQKFLKTADVVLVDAPCSGWGVLRRNPDIKFRQGPEELERLPRLQLQLLDRYSVLVKSGGSLVYSLCSFRKAETLEVVRQFSESHPDFELRQGGFMGPGPSDGFFIQRWVRR